MESTPPPLVGFNNNVRYRGMRFHIQTEDSGVSRPHIITHLFADGGRVIKSLRTDYSEYVNRPDRPELIARLMREQHRAMALDLRDGRLDDTIPGLAPRGHPEAPIPEVSKCPAPPTAEPRAPSEPPASARPRRKATSSRAAAGSPAVDSPKKRARQSGTPRKRSQQPVARKPGRPSAALPMKPSAESIFGTAPQESLDEVILSYVSHTKNGPPTRRTK